MATEASICKVKANECLNEPLVDAFTKIINVWFPLEIYATRIFATLDPSLRWFIGDFPLTPQYFESSLSVNCHDGRRQVARLVVAGLWWSLFIVGNREYVLCRREVFEDVQKPGYERRGLWWSCQQRSYDGRRWSYMVADIYLVPQSCNGRRLVDLARPLYDGRRAIGDF